MSDLPEGHHRIGLNDLDNFTVDDEGNLYWKGKRLKLEGDNNKPSSTPAPNAAPPVGDEMPDGTIYAGISPDTGKRMYATPADAPGGYTFKKAARYAKKLEAHGHKDWRVPTKNELIVLYHNRNKGKLKGTFNETGADAAGWYWSSSPCNYNRAGGQLFSRGTQYNYDRGIHSSLRCVR